MTAFLDIALTHARRGWHVHPLKAAGKIPVTQHGKNDATLDEAVIRDWWARMPNSNVGISCGPSGLCVLDADHGLASYEDFKAWRDRNGLPVTYSVRSGRRPEFGVQSYYAGSLKDGKFELDGVTGEIKSLGGLVLAAGCIHPDSKERYYVLEDAPLAPVPAIVEQSRLRTDATGKREWSLPVHDGQGRDAFLISQAGRLRNAGASETIIRAHLEELNQDPEVMADPKTDAALDRIARSAARYDVPAPEPVVVFGSKEQEEQKITDWRELFHTKDEALNAPPVSFLINGFLQREGVTGIAAPVRERKSLIAINIVHALLTGEKLFDHFEVVTKPSRVLYLCPEVSLGPFTDRVKKIGLIDHVGERLFYRTLSKDGHLKIDDPLLAPALPGSVVFLDTAVRFMEGDESSSQDARVFADSIFALLQGGAESVVMLHHSPKEAGDVMTLENAMRGSGDLGAFLACCWGTRLQDPQHPYESRSYLENLKMRDFESQPFEVTCGPDCRMHIAGDPSTEIVKLQTRRGNKGNKDGKDAAAEAVIKAKVHLPVRKLKDELAALEIERGTTWIAKTLARVKAEMGVSGVRVSG
jgi:hypothetical protein